MVSCWELLLAILVFSLTSAASLYTDATDGSSSSELARRGDGSRM